MKYLTQKRLKKHFYSDKVVTLRGNDSSQTSIPLKSLIYIMAIKTNAQQSIITRDLNKLTNPTGNIYEAVVIISRRANQIAAELKEELSNKLLDFAHSTDTLEEVYENREQIEISRHYERLPKATNIAMEEFLEGKIVHKYPAPPVV